MGEPPLRGIVASAGGGPRSEDRFTPQQNYRNLPQIFNQRTLHPPNPGNPHRHRFKPRTGANSQPKPRFDNLPELARG